DGVLVIDDSTLDKFYAKAIEPLEVFPLSCSKSKTGDAFSRRVAGSNIRCLHGAKSGQSIYDGEPKSMEGTKMTEISSATTIGFIGLGVMGKAMARNLIKAGFQVVMHNRSRAAVDELAAIGGSAQSFVMQNHAKRFLDGQLAPGFRTALLLKDLRLAAAATQDAGSFAPIAALAGQLLTALCNTGREGMDNAAMGLLYEELSGIKR
ncbi:MAG: NAD(P)-binding domain-containing protein, partial [Burkholderiales bacterium]